jgi:hypothetical protein
MSPLPLPVRIAAGLVATAVEQARELPRHVVEFPVTAISQALQTSMRMQQIVTELAIKGDQALGVLHQAEENPAWATFDDEEPPARNGASTVTRLRPPPSQPTAADVAARTTAEAAAGTQPDDVTDDPDDATGPNVLPGYRDMTIPQLRARLRKLTVEDLRALLVWETAHDDRPAYVTMLTNRITTVTEG